MRYDFDTPVDRRATASIKWDYRKRFTGLEGMLPLWVADMDFPACAEVIEALKGRTGHGVFGYTLEPPSYYQAVIDWMRRRHGWEIRRDWMVSAPGVVPSLNLALLACSQPGDGVIIQPPVYYPFRESIENNERRVVENPLRGARVGTVLGGGDFVKRFQTKLKGDDPEVSRLRKAKPRVDLAKICHVPSSTSGSNLGVYLPP